MSFSEKKLSGMCVRLTLPGIHMFQAEIEKYTFNYFPKILLYIIRKIPSHVFLSIQSHILFFISR